MGYFDGLGDYNNTTGVQPSASHVVNGNSARVQTGDLYDEQNGNATVVWNGNGNSFRKGSSNSLVEGVMFSTTLGASLATVAGGNVATSGGGVIEMVGPFSMKTVLGWDVDLKLALQNKVSRGRVYEYHTSYTYRQVDNEWELLPERWEFQRQMQATLDTARSEYQSYRAMVGDAVQEKVLDKSVTILGDDLHEVGKYQVKAESIGFSTGGDPLVGGGALASFLMSDAVVMTSSEVRVRGQLVKLG